MTDIPPEAGDPLRPAAEPVSFEPFEEAGPATDPTVQVAVPVREEAPLPNAGAELLDVGQQPAPVPADDEPEPERDAIAAALVSLDDRLAEGQRLLSRQTDIAAALHSENLQLKEGELRKAQQPLVRDILRVHDDVNQMIRSLAAEETAIRDLDLIRTALVDALGRNGIEPVACEPGDAFDPRAHKVAGVRPTQDPSADRTVAEVVRHGFAWEDGELVRVADVAVAKFRPAEPAPEPAAQPSDAGEAAVATNSDSAAG